MSISRTASLARPKTLAAVLTVLLLVGCTAPTQVSDLFVDPQNGSDANPGSSAAPYKTLTHALEVAAPGRTIHLAAGKYDEGSGEVWPTQSGAPPSATPNVPHGVTITTDGNAALLSGPGGMTTTSALVFAGEASVEGLTISGFLRGVLAGPGTIVVLEDVEVTGSALEGVLAYGDADVTLRSSELHGNSGAGVSAQGDATVAMRGMSIHENSPGLNARGSAAVSLVSSEVYLNGTLVPGGEHSGVSVVDEATFTSDGGVIRDNAYAGIYMGGAATVNVGAGSVIHGNFIGVVADPFEAGEASIDFQGATIRDNDFEGIFWAVPLGASFTMRDTSVVDNGDNGIYFLGDAQVIDLGTAANPGGNDYSGNGEPLILDGRPDRAVADGTIITVSYDDTISPCLVGGAPVVGPVVLGCDGITVISITGGNNRVQVTSEF